MNLWFQDKMEWCQQRTKLYSKVYKIYLKIICVAHKCDLFSQLTYQCLCEVVVKCCCGLETSLSNLLLCLFTASLFLRPIFPFSYFLTHIVSQV